MIRESLRAVCTPAVGISACLCTVLHAMSFVAVCAAALASLLMRILLLHIAGHGQLRSTLEAGGCCVLWPKPQATCPCPPPTHGSRLGRGEPGVKRRWCGGVGGRDGRYVHAAEECLLALLAATHPNIQPHHTPKQNTHAPVGRCMHSATTAALPRSLLPPSPENTLTACATHVALTRAQRKKRVCAQHAAAQCTRRCVNQA